MIYFNTIIQSMGGGGGGGRVWYFWSLESSLFEVGLLSEDLKCFFQDFIFTPYHTH